ncbi:MAG: transposase [Planctomycetaceae bacterium]|nr:transposase [Planctomycetaceae bacterium]
MVDQLRQAQRYQGTVRDDEQSLICDILSLVRQLPQYGYGTIWSKLKQLGWQRLNVKRVCRIRQQEGLKLQKKKLKNAVLATVPIRLFVIKPKASMMFGAGILFLTAPLATAHSNGLSSSMNSLERICVWRLNTA